MGRFRIRTTDRTPAPIFHGGHGASRRQDPGMLAGGHTADSRFPTLLQKIESRHTQADGNEAQGEQREGRQEFPDKVKLERGDTP